MFIHFYVFYSPIKLYAVITVLFQKGFISIHQIIITFVFTLLLRLCEGTTVYVVFLSDMHQLLLFAMQMPHFTGPGKRLQHSLLYLFHILILIKDIYSILLCIHSNKNDYQLR